jgi:hypothetical protein
LCDAFDLLSDSLNFLFGCLSAERGHPIPSLSSYWKQETFPRLHRRGNALPPKSRLRRQET